MAHFYYGKVKIDSQTEWIRKIEIWRSTYMHRILITGAAGFIGSHLSRSLLEDGYDVLGLDNLNDYYTPLLKRARLVNLEKFEKFSFKEMDISNREELESAFNSFNPDYVVNLAAQAGVRYSLENPYAYMDTNLVGFLNVLEQCRHSKVEGLIYASSSSVYGSNEKIPFEVTDRVDHPISLYAATKRANELIAHSYSHLFGLHTTGLRFFTAYGPWGRPDMAMYIFADKISKGETINVFNHGDMYRDFTYIDDIVSGTRKAMDKNYKYEIFNLGNHRSEKLLEMIEIIEVELGKKAIMNFLPMQPGDISESFADIAHSEEKLGYCPSTTMRNGVPRFINWFKEYHGK